MIRLEPETELSSIYARREVHEEYFCNYEVNPEFERALIASGLRVSGRGPQGEIRAVESRGNRFLRPEVRIAALAAVVAVLTLAVVAALTLVAAARTLVAHGWVGLAVPA